MRINGATGTMTLMTERDDTTGQDVRVLRLGAVVDGRPSCSSTVTDVSPAFIAKYATRLLPQS
jgi:hypothetical protein